MWILVRIRSTGQIIEMLPGAAEALIASGLAERVERIEKKSLVTRGREIAASFCNAIGAR
jgi:hypothetical protein